MRLAGKTLSTIGKLLLVFIFGWPFFWLISMSLQTIEEANSLIPTLWPATLQFKNYATAWNATGSYSMLHYFKNSIIVTGSSVVIQVLIMVPAAYAFAKYKFKGSGIMFTLILAALMVPSQVTFFPLYSMFSSFNWIDSLLPLILPGMTNVFGIFLLRQYFKQVPEEIIESAKLDNASDWAIMFKIMLPMSSAAVASIVLFSVIGTWNDYFWPLVMTNSDAVRTLPIAIQRLKEVEGLANWNVVMAGNAILTLPVLVVYLFTNRKIMNAFAYSGIK